MGMWKSPKRLYVNKEGALVVPEDSPEAASLLVAEGSEIPEEQARRLGLIKEKGSKGK